MDSNKLRAIIRDKNEAREGKAADQAERIIENIVSQQACIATAQAKIKELREELAALQVEELDPSAILGDA